MRAAARSAAIAAAAVLPLLGGVAVAHPVAAGAGRAAAAATANPEVSSLEADEGSTLWGVAAANPDEAMSVGRGGESGEARARHWDGQRWTQTNPPGGPSSELYAVTAISPTDVWATGNAQGRALANHWDGTTWTRVPTPPPGEGDTDFLKAVDGIATDDVWAVGYTRLDFGGNDVKPLIEHWDGESWREFPYELPYGNTLGILRGVTVISATDAWAVGDTYGKRSATLLLHWDGYSWEPVTDALITNSGSGLGGLWAVDAVSTDDVWAVGAGRGRAIAHWDGRVWTRMRAPGSTRDWLVDRLTGVSAVATDDVWAVGAYGDTSYPQHPRILHWDGQRWERVRSQSPGVTVNELNAVSATGPDDAWAVGAFINSRGTFHLYLHWDGEKWTRVRPGEHPR